MIRVDNEKRIQGYIKKYQLQKFAKNYTFELYHFDPHEILNQKLNPRQYLLFLVSGTCEITTLRKNGTLFQITRISTFSCFGDMEFAVESIRQNEIETISECEFLALDLMQYRSKLSEDPAFLRFLLKSIVEKMEMISSETRETTDVESKVLYYISHQSPSHKIIGIEKTAQEINCSRRQLERVLKKLCAESILAKEKKGVYKKHA